MHIWPSWNRRLIYSVLSCILFLTQPLTAQEADLGTGQLVFSRSDAEGTFAQIVTLDLATGTETILTDETLWAYDPIWSPDGEHIAFYASTTSEGTFDLYMMTADGTVVRQLTDDPAGDYSPGWSPDGEQLVFISERNGSTELHLLNIVSGSVQALPVTEPFVEFPAWSTDGEKIAYGGEAPDASVNIYVLDLKTMVSRQLTEYFYATAPQWSPDGRFIAFDAEDDFGNSDIYIMSATGLLPRRLTRADAFDFAPAWSADSTQLSFTTDRDGDAEIYIMGANGGNMQRVTTSPLEEVFAPWRPISE